MPARSSSTASASRTRLGAASAAASFALLAAGRYALGQNDDPGTLFYVVAPLAFVGCLGATVAALVLLPDLGRAATGFGLAATAALFALSPGTSDGPHSVMFGAYAVGVLVAGERAVRRVRRATPSAPATGIFLATRALLLVLLAAALALGAILILLLSSGYES